MQKWKRRVCNIFSTDCENAFRCSIQQNYAFYVFHMFCRYVKNKLLWISLTGNEILGFTSTRSP